MLSTGAVLLIAAFAVLLVMGVPIAVALGLSGVVVVITQNLGIASLPTNVWTGIAKYPLLALPVFIAAGMVFERSGVAERLVRFMSALVGRRAGGLALVAILVSMILGGISGSGAADAVAGSSGTSRPRSFTSSSSTQSRKQNTIRFAPSSGSVSAILCPASVTTASIAPFTTDSVASSTPNTTGTIGRPHRAKR